MTRTNPYRAFRAVLARRQTLSENVVRLTFAHPDLADFGDTGLDQRLKLVFCREEQQSSALAADDWAAWWRAQPDDVRPRMRTYTVRAARPEECEVDVDVVCHGVAGPASRFALTAEVGSAIILVGPDSAVPGHAEVGLAFKPGTAEEFLLVGDETALPAIANILAALPPHASGAAFLEVPSNGDVQHLPHPPGLALTWLPRARSEAAAGTVTGAVTGDRGDALCTAVFAWLDARVAEECPGRPGSGSVIEAGADTDETDTIGGVLWAEAETPDSGGGLCTWVAADAGTVRTLRRGLVRERGLPRSGCSFMGYWREGAAEGE